MDPYPKENLNGVPNLTVLKNRDGLVWKDFRRQLKPNFSVVIANILLSWSMIALAVLAFVALNALPTWVAYAFIPLGGLWYAFWVQSYSSHFHEAAHYNFAPRHLNDPLARIFLTPFIGLDVKSYRVSHWQHHRFLGDPRDTEISYHEPLTLTRILEGFSGLYLVRSLARYLWNYRRINQPVASARPETSKPFSFFGPVAYALVVQSLILFLLFRFVSLPAAIAWAFGFFLVGSFLSILRQTLEHRSLDAPGGVDFKKVAHGAVNRLFGVDLLSKNFGGAGFNRHLLHHWDPTISYTRFDELEAFLLQSELHDELERQRTTYWKTFREMFRWR